MSIDADWEGFQEELQQLTEALAEFPRIAAGDVRGGVEKALLLLQGRAAEYPPAPVGSGYRRTGTLGRLWAGATRVVELGESGAFVQGRVGNATPYSPYVQGPDDQAQVHKGRWQTTDQIVDAAGDEIGLILEDAGASIVRHLAEEAEG
jgi:hypothetical protein